MIATNSNHNYINIEIKIINYAFMLLLLKRSGNCVHHTNIFKSIRKMCVYVCDVPNTNRIVIVLMLNIIYYLMPRTLSYHTMLNLQKKKIKKKSHMHWMRFYI